MFSQLGPLFKTTFRQAEANDTRQHIPHDERDKGRRKREEEEAQNKGNEPWEDDTAVSVDALQAFLINFLRTLPDAVDGATTPTESQDGAPISQRPKEPERPTNTRNAKAVRAYQTMAQQAQKDTPPPIPEDTNNDPTADKLQSKELRDIHALIDNLDILKQRNVQNLRIQPAESFIESLKNAVRQHM